MNRHHSPVTTILCFAGLLLSSVILFSCKSTQPTAYSQAKEKSIVILYENDVHCGIDGYSKIRGLADAIQQSDTSYVAIVSSGDFLQGALAGAFSRGQYIVDIMRQVGYDAITLGNHEFDYGAPRMFELLPQIGAPIVSTNFCDYETRKPFYQPYVIKQYGQKRIAFVGVTTTETLRAESYAFFDSNRKQLYDLCSDRLVQLVQQAIDHARAEGADYVVLLSHVGELSSENDLTSQDLVAATRGIDAVLDGHSHSIIPVNPVANLDGKQIPVSQTGTQFENIGKLWISPDGRFVTSLVANASNPYTNARVTAVTDSIKALLEQATSRQIATIAFDMPVQDANGLWIVRREESPMGNLVSDAFRWKMNAAIGLVNGGGIRNSIKAGAVNYGHAISVQPFDNLVCIIEATGRQIIDMLTKCASKCPEADGSFPQVSGMRYTIHTDSHTVSDILVFDREANAYQPLDPQRTYTIATTDYYGNGGYYETLQGCRLIENTQILARDVLTEYIEKELKGSIGDSYRTTQGRITIIAQPQHHPHHNRMAFTTDTVMVHDPVMAYENGTYYLLSTGRGISWATSKDRKTWVVQPTPFIEHLPQWTRDSVPGFHDHVWAPDIIRWHNRWWLTYSCSTFGKNTSAIGLMSSDRIDGQWKDEGCIVRSEAKRDDWNAIDSNIAVDDDDQLWMVWGSFWDGIQIAPLTVNGEKLCSVADSQPKTIARRYRPNDPNAAENPTSKYAGRNAIEAPFIFKKNGWYYLFVAWDYCCRGAKSNYRVVVGRSKTISGPYLDHEGNPMIEGGGTLFLEGDKKEFEAAGHCAAYTFGQEDLFICHGYSVKMNGASLLIQRRISWTPDGWPMIR